MLYIGEIRTYGLGLNFSGQNLTSESIFKTGESDIFITTSGIINIIPEKLSFQNFYPIFRIIMKFCCQNPIIKYLFLLFILESRISSVSFRSTYLRAKLIGLRATDLSLAGRIPLKKTCLPTLELECVKMSKINTVWPKIDLTINFL